jgi:probable rRNA maturation factor
LNEAQDAVRLKGEVTVLLTTNAAIRKLNRRFRGKNKSTDVLSFPAEGVGAEEIAGDLAISVPTALRQAAEQSHSLSTEIKVLILHGLLHLAGGDHETDSGQMARRERLLRGRLGLPQGLIERAGGLEKPVFNSCDEGLSKGTPALKGHGFSRAAKGPKRNAVLAAKGMQPAGKALPQGRKPKTLFAHRSARLKSCLDTMPDSSSGRSPVRRPAPNRTAKVNRP